MTAGWVVYSWPPAIVLVSVMLIFLLDFVAEQYVERKYDLAQSPNIENLITDHPGGDSEVANAREDQNSGSPSHQQLTSGDQDKNADDDISAVEEPTGAPVNKNGIDLEKSAGSFSRNDVEERSFREQIAAFLILEFGVIFHSVIIGLNLGVAGSEFSTLYPVLVFHQSFEGLGIGARLSAIPIPKRFRWLPWFLCTAYGLTTPISIAIGLGLRTTYNSGSFTANVVSGLLDSISAGILIYTGLVELLARDFLFNPELTKDSRRLVFMVVCVFVGAALMALLGKWA